mmetsp:Transcript_22284/g.76430  ORF Transcript_22284/g.76430 Transcript_22284/m.76430 type:complete len:664 (-) Transcript_22284:67-2058(-)
MPRARARGLRALVVLMAAFIANGADPGELLSVPCPTDCGASSVILLGDQNRAGFADRQTVVGSMAMLAASLCAKLVAPKPCRALNGKHGVQVHCDVDWADYFDVFANGSGVILRAADADAVRIRAASLPWLRSADAASAVSALDRAVEHRRRGEAFVWEIDNSFYQWRDALHARARVIGLNWTGKPDFRRRHLPDVVENGVCAVSVSMRIANLTKAAAAAIGGNFDALHLRRTDGRAECATEPENVAAYLGCAESLRTADDLLLFTDEQSATYLDRVRNLAAVRHKGRVIDGDAAVLDVLRRAGHDFKQDSGPTHYFVGRQLQGLAGARFDMARATCRTTVLQPGNDSEAKREIARRCEAEAVPTAVTHSAAAAALTAALNASKAAGSWVAHAGAKVAVLAPIPQKPPKLFIGVLSAPANFLARSAVRGTWLRLATDFAYAFIVGLPFGEAQATENATHGDLALVDSLDHYMKFSSLLPLKTYTILWLAYICSAQFTLKTDDDSFVHSPRLMAALPKSAERYYGGFILDFRLHRLKYAQGGGYVFSTNETPCLLDKAAAHWEMQREDVFAGLAARDCGLNVSKIHNISLCDPKFARHFGCAHGARVLGPDFARGLVIRHKLKPMDLVYLWETYFQPNATLPASTATEAAHHRPETLVGGLVLL